MTSTFDKGDSKSEGEDSDGKEALPTNEKKGSVVTPMTSVHICVVGEAKRQRGANLGNGGPHLVGLNGDTRG